MGWKTKALEVKKFEIANDNAKIHIRQINQQQKAKGLLLRKLDLKKSSENLNRLLDAVIC